jgi:putative DNA methylase
MRVPTKPRGGRMHTRGYLPHVDGEGLTQFITFRLADSMPQDLLEKWRSELESGEITDVDMRKRIEQFLDSGYGSCCLRDRRVAEVIRDTLIKWDITRYRLIAWVIMPNHVHLLIETLEGYSLSEVMHSVKSNTAHEANRILDRKGRFWSVESFDRYIRDARHFRNTVAYIENNPVKAGLCLAPEEWEFSSAFVSG